MDILRGEGHKLWGGKGDVKPAEGIAANRWATRVEQVMDALKSPASSGWAPYGSSTRGAATATRIGCGCRSRRCSACCEEGEATVDDR
jgi:hypothetical protein